MQSFLSRVKEKIDPIILKNGRRVELVNFCLMLICAGIVYFLYRYDFFCTRVISALVVTLFALVEMHIVAEFRKMPEEEREEISIIEWEHPYYTLACLVFIACVFWGVLIWEIFKS